MIGSIAPIARLPKAPPSLAWLLVFWVVTNSVFTARGRLLSDPLAWVSIKRLVAISVGTLFLWAAIEALRRARGLNVIARVGWIVGLTAIASIALFAVGSSIDGFGSGAPSSIEQEIRWLLVWLGYFLGSLALISSISVGNARRPLDVLLGAEVIDSSLGSVEKPDGEIWVDTKGSRIRIVISDIERVEAEGNYVRVFATTGTGMLRVSMSEMARRLGSHEFLRTHRSAICRKSSISAVKRLPSGAYEAVLRSGASVPVGRSTGRALLSAARPPRRQ